MKYLFLGFGILLTHLTFAQRVAYSITVEDIERHLIVYTPSSYDGSEEVPVVFMLHGSGGDGDRFYRISGWKEKADEEGFIAVFPSALEYCIEDGDRIRTTTKWNEGKLSASACDPSSLKDDVLFISTIIDLLEENYTVDSRRIYMTGFSNGGAMATRLALELSDRIAAAGIAAGGIQVSAPEEHDHIPITYILGNEDSKILSHFEEALDPRSPEELWEIEGLQTFVGHYLEAWDLSDEHSSNMERHSIGLKFSTSLEGHDNSFHFILLQDLEHKFPNGTNNPHGFNASDKFWEFYSLHSK